MSNRLDQDRQKQLEPTRTEYAKKQIEALGFEVQAFPAQRTLHFRFKDKLVTFYPYSGWATGKSIKDGRGLQNLLKQLK